MFLFNKKFITGLILLFLVCFLVFFPVFSSISQAQEDPSDPLFQHPGVPSGVGPKQSENLKNSGSGKADKVSGVPGTALLVATAMLNVIGSFCGWIISVEAGILNWILNPENIRMATAPIVVIGWDVTRTTVNMFFVLVLLVVAFATILRIETYSLKAILPRLIIVALLINFSLVIAGAILDFANVMTNFFFTRLTEGGSDIATALQNGLKLTEYYRTKDNTSSPGVWKAAGTLIGISSFSISVFVYALLAVIFLIAAIFIFIALIAMMLIRALHIWILLILAPAAWFFYIIPALQNQWYKWWNNFFRWAFFAPIAMFFVYLSITTLINVGKDRTDNTGRNLGQDIEWESLQASARATTAGQKEIMSKNMVESVFQMFIGMGLLLGSLTVANSLSITGAGMATRLGKRMGMGMAAWAGIRAQRSLTWGSKYDKEGKEVKKSYFERGLKTLAKVPMLGQLSRPGFAALERQKSYIQEVSKKYDSYSTERLQAIMPRLSKEHQMAANLAIMRKQEFNKLSDAEKVKAINLAQKFGMGETRMQMMKLDPTIAYSLTKGTEAQNTLLQSILAEMKADDWKNMSDKFWKLPGITEFVHNNLTTAQLAKMMPNLSFEGREAQKKYFKSLLTKSDEDAIKIKVESEIKRKGLQLTDEQIKKMVNNAIVEARIDKYGSLYGKDKAEYLRSAPGRKAIYET